MGTPLTKTQQPSDLVKWETSHIFCREGGTYTNGSGAEVTIEDGVGYPITYNDSTGAVTLCLQATEADVNAVMVAKGKHTVADGDSIDVEVIRRGPAILNEAALATEDVASDSFTLATLKTNLEAEDFQFTAEAVETETQST